MPDLDLDAIEARVNAARPGPWTWCRTTAGSYGSLDSGDDEVLSAQGHIDGWIDSDDADAEFIAHAREDIPALVARIRELEARAQAVRDDIGPRRDGWYEQHRSYVHDLLDGKEPADDA